MDLRQAYEWLLCNTCNACYVVISQLQLKDVKMSEAWYFSEDQQSTISLPPSPLYSVKLFVEVL